MTTAHAVQPPVHAPAPPVQRKPEARDEPADRPQRLLASLASIPAVQRKCTACSAEDDERQMPVMPRLEVGPVDDPYEREADAIAGQVMAMRQPAIQRLDDTEEGEEVQALRAPGSIQRNCADCNGTPVTPKLEVGPIDDPYEREADAIAGRVMAMREPVRRLMDEEAPDEVMAKRVTIQRQSEDVSEEIDDRLMARRASVQRECAACTAEEETAVQPCHAPTAIQRTPAALLETDPLRDLTDMPRMKAEAKAAGTEHIAASASQLTSGGSPLFATTREFFESRMGRDMSHVRVHSDGEANTYNISIRARAFTYKNHVWLGAGESSSQTFTMAHELTHVMQQTAPGPLGPRARRVMRVPCDPLADNLFFAPTTGTQKKAEQNFIKKLTTGTGVIGEAPVPNATKGQSGCDAVGKIGRADLMKTNNGKIIGFHFDSAKGAQVPRPWYAPSNTVMGCGGASTLLVPKPIRFRRQMYINGKPTWGKLGEHTAPAGSRFGRSFFKDASDAPSLIQIGEVKFGGTPGARKGAKAQIDHYVGGVKFAHRGYENIRQNIGSNSRELRPGKKPQLAAWSTLTADPLTSISGIADGWQAQGESQDLVIARWVRPLVPVNDREVVAKKCNQSDKYPGKLYHGHDSGLPHVWLYAWYPDSHPPANATTAGGKPGAKYTSSRAIAEKLIGQATSAPGSEKVPRLAVTAKQAPLRVMRGPKPARPIPTADPFAKAYPQWKTERKQLAKDFGGYKKTKAFGKDTLPILFNQALKNTKAITGTAPSSVTPDTSALAKKAEKGLRNIEIITGPAGPILGELRFRLGTVFLKVLGAYNKIREKIAGFFQKKPSGSGSGLAARALKVFTKILGAVASFLLPRVTDALIECVETGLKATLERWIDESPLAKIKETFESYQRQALKLKEDIFGSVEAFVNNTFGSAIKSFNEVKKVVKDAANIVSIAKRAFDVARAAACLAGGLETAGISCVVAAVDKLLGLINASPSEHLLGWLLESCPAQEYFAKALLAFDQITKIPNAIAKKIVESVGPALPSWLQTFVCDPQTMDGINATLPTFDEVACNGGGKDLSRRGRPSGVDTSVDRIPTDEEKRKLGGFDAKKWAAKRPTKPKPKQTAPSSSQTPSPTPPPSGGGSEKPKNSAAQGTTGKGQTGSGSAAGRKTSFEIDAKKVSVIGPTPKEFKAMFVHGVERGFRTDSKGEYNGRCYSKNVKFSILDTLGFHQDNRKVAVKVCKLEKIAKPPYPDTPNKIWFEPKSDVSLKVNDENGQILVHYAMRGGKRYSAWLAQRKPD